MRRLTGLLCAALLIALTGGGADANSYKEESFTCSGWANNSEYGCKISGANNNNAPFSFNMVNPMAYIVERTWARARLADVSSWTEVADHKANIASGSGVSFRFDEEWIAAQLSTDVATLQSKGFEFRFKIKSVGGGSGREDTCKVSEVAYNASSGTWSWRQKSADDWKPAGQDHAFTYKAGGSVNAVTCRVDKIS
jgi:hypothetical protein